MIDGKKEAKPIRESPTPLQISGAYLKGFRQGLECDLSNPQFSTYMERIAFRNGWMKGRYEADQKNR